MGFKSKATKANKAKKVDRAPIKRVGTGCKWGGMSTHQPIHEHVKGSSKGNMTQTISQLNGRWKGDPWKSGLDDMNVNK